MQKDTNDTSLSEEKNILNNVNYNLYLIKKLITVIVTLMILWFISIIGVVGGFLHYLHRQEYLTEVQHNITDIAQDTADGNNIIHNNGGKLDGKSKNPNRKNNNTQEEK